MLPYAHLRSVATLRELNIPWEIVYTKNKIGIKQPANSEGLSDIFVTL